MATLEKRFIVHALNTAKDNRTQAARLLGLTRTTLLEKMRRHGIPLLPRPGSRKAS